jgi:hypothetical protein
VREEAITELLAKLASRSEDWALKETPDDYDEGLYESISENALARKTLDDSLTTIRELLDVQVPDSLKDAYLRLLFANVISALETFLSDTFINRVVPDSDLLQTYVDGEPKFIERKVLYKDVLREGQRLTEEARKELLDTVWHNMGKVKPMYARVLGINLGDISALSRAIQVRHDIVHRNGRQKNGTVVSVNDADVANLLSDIRELGARVDLKIDYGFEPEVFDGIV